MNAWQLGGSSSDRGYDLAIDGSGNIVSCGLFSNIADFDPGAGTNNMTAIGAYDLYVVKLSSTGVLSWAKQVGGENILFGDEYTVYGYSLDVDGSNNIYISGIFDGTVDFDPGAGTTTLTTSGGLTDFDCFVLKLNSSGAFQWVKQIEVVSASGTYLDVNASGDVFVTGNFTGTVDFDPGAGVSNLASAGGKDVFVLKLDASGNYQWAKKLGGSGDDDGYSITQGFANTYIYTTGYFSGTADFDPGVSTYTMTSAGNKDVFISKLDASGNFLWAGQAGGSQDDMGYSVFTDPSSNIFLAGSFRTTPDFDPGVSTYTLTSQGSSDIFTMKLNSSGAFVWASQQGGAGAEVANAMTVDGNGNVYTTGYFEGTCDFDPGAGTYNLTSSSTRDIYISKLNSSGAFVWTGQVVCGSTTDLGSGIVLDKDCYLYSTGWFGFGGFTGDFDPGGGTYNLTSPGVQEESYIWKLDATGGGCSLMPVELMYFVSTCDDAGRTVLKWATASERNNHYFSIEKGEINGGILDWHPAGSIAGAGTSSAVNEYTFVCPGELQPEEETYFRLSQTDYDGRSEVFSSISSRCTRPESSIVLSPDMESGILTIHIYHTGEKGVLSLIDAQGRIIRDMAVSDKEVKLTTDISSLITGVYLVRFVYGYQSITSKLWLSAI